MTAISPRVPLGRLRGFGNPFAACRQSLIARLVEREELPRPPAYVVLCATVTVLNVVGLVMILSASSVAALSDYGSSWYFFNRQLVWAIFGLGRVPRRVPHRLPQVAPLRAVAARARARHARRSSSSAGSSCRARPRWLVFGPDADPTERDREVGAARVRRRDPRQARRPDGRPPGVAPGARRSSCVFGALVMKEPDLASTIVLGVDRGRAADRRRRPGQAPRADDRYRGRRHRRAVAARRLPARPHVLVPASGPRRRQHRLPALPVADRDRERRAQRCRVWARAGRSGSSSRTRTPTSSSRSSAKSSVSSAACWCSDCSSASVSSGCASHGVRPIASGCSWRPA